VPSFLGEPAHAQGRQALTVEQLDCGGGDGVTADRLAAALGWAVRGALTFGQMRTGRW